LTRHDILSVSKAKARLLDLTRKIQEAGRAYIPTRDGEPVSALVPIEDYESLLETMDILADKKTLRDLAVALADERHGRLFKRDSNGRWSKYKKTKRVA
jgi:prevent-host-death family protein